LSTNQAAGHHRPRAKPAQRVVSTRLLILLAALNYFRLGCQTVVAAGRHCCEMWYKQTVSARQVEPGLAAPLSPGVALQLYELDVPWESHLVIATLESERYGFFGIGASMRRSLADACAHSIGEIAAIFEDAKLSRSGHTPTVTTKSNILSLRDSFQSHRRKCHFRSILNQANSAPKKTSLPIAYTFKVSEGLFAARASSEGLLAPRRFHTNDESVPVLPLF
jgi:hypothetical protein